MSLCRRLCLNTSPCTKRTWQLDIWHYMELSIEWGPGAWNHRILERGCLSVAEPSYFAIIHRPQDHEFKQFICRCQMENKALQYDFTTQLAKLWNVWSLNMPELKMIHLALAENIFTFIFSRDDPLCLSAAPPPARFAQAKYSCSKALQMLPSATFWHAMTCVTNSGTHETPAKRLLTPVWSNNTNHADACHDTTSHGLALAACNMQHGNDQQWFHWKWHWKYSTNGNLQKLHESSASKTASPETFVIGQLRQTFATTCDVTTDVSAWALGFWKWLCCGCVWWMKFS